MSMRMWRRVSFHQDNVIKHGPEWTRMVSVESLDAPRQSHPSASAYTRSCALLTRATNRTMFLVPGYCLRLAFLGPRNTTVHAALSG